MVGLNGLEPSTSRLSGVRSNQLSYRPLFAFRTFCFEKFNLSKLNKEGYPVGFRITFNTLRH